ncbi:MAG: PQQ-like beta-propeller repeat protein, partial [Gemmatimonadota bacterium]|nr:PQQ-like beta-propeller repeat protein [Gemmatimonadota bacterium]
MKREQLCHVPRQASIRRTAVLAALGAALVAGDVGAQSDTLWRKSVSGSVRYMSLDEQGHLLVVNEDGITALDPDSGSRVWRYPIRQPVRVQRQTSTGHLLVGAERTLAALDLMTGQPVWRRDDLPDLGKTWVDTDRRDSVLILQTRNGFAVLDLVTGATRWDSTALPQGTVVREFFRLRSLNLLFLLAKTPTNPVTFMGVNLDSGVVLWSDPAMFRSEVKFKRTEGVEYAVVHSPLALADSTMVLYFSTEGPIRVDPRTGAVLWRSEALAGAPVPTSRDGYARSLELDSLLIVPSRKTLVAIDLATGLARWATQGEFPDQPAWLRAGTGAIVTGNSGTGSPFVAVVGLDGVRRRPTEWRLEPGARALLLNDTAYVTNAGQLYALSLETGLERKLASTGFKGDEKPLDIDSLADGGLLLMGRQNLTRINLDGTVVYHRYYPAPAVTFWEEFSAVTSGVNAPRHAWSARAQEYFY